MRPAIGLLLLALLTLVAAPARGAAHDTGRDGPSAVLLRAMQDEMKRTLERLRIQDVPGPHFVAYTVRESRKLDIEATLGTIEDVSASRSRRLQVEIRVGSPELNDAHFLSGRLTRAFRPWVAALPLEDDYDALRLEIWGLSDRVYKVAVETLARKKVYKEKNNIQEDLADLSVDPVDAFRETREIPEFDRAFWESSLRQVSGVFRNFPDLESSDVELSFRADHVYIIDSEGRSVIKPDPSFEIEIEAAAQAADGMEQADGRVILRRSIGDLPPPKELLRLAAEVGHNATALARAPKLDAYLGPVLLEGAAAGELFNQLLASGVGNPRAPWVNESWAESRYPAGSLTSRVGLRVVAPLLSAYDDPTVAEIDGDALVGHYRVDDQGIPARRVSLIESGILRDLLMSRSPTRERSGSNGHGRGFGSEYPSARIGNLFVVPSRTVPLDELKQMLRDEARAFGLDRAILVRRIGTDGDRDRDAMLAAPVLVYEVDVDTGEERLVRDARFVGVTLRALRDIVAASDRHVLDVWKKGPYSFSNSTPASIVHPSVLLAEMELAKTDDKPSQLPHLPAPAARPQAPD